MPKRSRIASPKKRNGKTPSMEALQQVIKETEGTGKNPVAVLLGRLGGLKGGKARAEKMTDEQRRESSVKAARARWGSS